MHPDLIGQFALQDTQNHPWWWPCGDGTEFTHWGLNPDELEEQGLDPGAVLTSLRLGPNLDEGAYHSDFNGFLGSIGEPAAPRIWIVTMRPSRNRWQQAKTVWLYNLLTELGILNQTRVTDVVKFRGAAPAQDAWAQADDQMRAISTQVLEWEYAGAPPDKVVLSGSATQNAFMNLLHSEILDAPDAHLTHILNEMHCRAHPVYFYSAQGLAYADILHNWTVVCENHVMMPTPAWLQHYRDVQEG